MTLAYIGLGSNLSNSSGNSVTILQHAVQGLHALGAVSVSGLYISTPLGPQDQPDYWNAVAALDTELTPHGLLTALQQLEQQAGRIRLRHWGERTLDLDILLYGQQRLQTSELTIPHAGLLLRNFVVLPLLELNAEIEIDGLPIHQSAAAQNHTGITKVANADWVTIEP